MNKTHSYLKKWHEGLNSNDPKLLDEIQISLFNQALDEIPWYGIEQEFFISRGGKPIGFIPNDIILKPQRDYYCGTGGDKKNTLNNEGEINGVSCFLHPSHLNDSKFYSISV